ncbi:MAG: hypothetical protein PGN37_06490 [Mycobacterium kyogaense]|uniref:hypothetical protein n=1 Tax=Mycobacterium kyogaense TaxID=2212479 RepID=UPI002FF90BA8
MISILVAITIVLSPILIPAAVSVCHALGTLRRRAATRRQETSTAIADRAVR